MIGARTFIEVSQGESFIHRLDPRAKIVLLVLVSIIAVALENARSLSCMLLLVALAYLSVRLPWSKVRAVILAAILITWGTMFSQGLFYAQEPRTVLLVLLPENTPIVGAFTGGIYVYSEGISHGAVQSMRMISLFATGLLFAWTTDPRDALYGLVGLRIPYGLAFMVITAMRFLPILIAEVGVVFSAQRLRGLRSSGRNPLALLRMIMRVIQPTMANSLRRAGTLTLSVQSRAFDPTAQRSLLRGYEWSWSARSLLLIVGFVMFGVVFAKVAYALYFNELYYNYSLRTLYTIVREFL
jgi:energy-coupling factor transport system permease protein